LLRNILQFLKLTFRSPDPFEPHSTEQEFLRDYAQRFLAHRRAISIMAVVYWSAYLVWDLFQALQSSEFQHVLSYVLLLRLFGVVCLTGYACLSFQKSFVNEHYATRLLIAMISTAYLLLGLILIVVPFPINHMYYSPGLFEVMIFTYGMFRLRAKPAIRLTFVFLLFSEFVYAFMANDSGGQYSSHTFSMYYFLFSSFYLISFAIIGCAIVIELERTARRAFFRERELSFSNNSIKAKNTELESLNGALEDSKRDTETKTAALVGVKEEARLSAERSNLNKSQFLADAAHDLRQPMQALSNLLEAAQHASLRADHNASGQLLANAQAALRAARSSFNAILDISRLESGFVEAQYSSFEIDDLVTEVISPLRLAADERGVTLRMRLGSGKTVVRSDPHLLSRVLTNIVANAIKYSDRSKAQPVVFVGIVRLPNRVRIDIIDNGIGIPSHHWENVFKPFFQLGNTERDREKGLGLGLSIVKSSMVLLSEHRIDMRSIEGRGTRFSFDIPRTDDLGTFKIIRHAEQSPIANDVSGLYVIYVEDDVLVRASTVALFQEYGILYEAVGSVSELKERLPLLERIPDLLITDYRLPGGGTAKDIMQLMSRYFDADIPVIILTGEVQTSRTELIGADVLSKPSSPEVLLAAIAARGQKVSEMA
jgi:two-component system, sensor histidine kinase